VLSTDPDFTPCCRNKSIEALFPEVGQSKASGGATSLAVAVPDRHAMIRETAEKRVHARRRDICFVFAGGIVFCGVII
jgi:hypothetical protein